jgi:hypothetical protein
MQPQHRGNAFDHTGGGFASTTSHQPDAKRPRTQGSDNKEDSDDDDDDDEDSDDDGDAGNTSKASATKPNRKIVKGPDGKPKVKLTRGSRACIA